LLTWQRSGGEAEKLEGKKMPSLGCIADTPDQRDFRFQIPENFIAKLSRQELPDMFSLTQLKTALPILDQGSIGSCVAHGSRTAFDALFVGTEIDFYPSRLFIYYAARSLEHTRAHDVGCQVRDGLKILVELGVFSEEIWPYDTAFFAVHPTPGAYKNAFAPGHQAKTYHRVNNDLYEIKAALYAGHPVVIGFSVYTSFYGTPSTGIMPETKGRLEGGHCVTIEGWDDVNQQVLCRNSWGEHWGMKGFFYMPYDFLLSENVFDLWVLTS
jgi:C1A family cysteine protease